MLTNNLKPHNVQITSNLKVAFKPACQKYQLALEVERSKKEKQAVEDKKAIILSEIEDVKSQITLLTKTSVVPEKGFALCAEQAEKENDILFGEQSECFEKKKWAEKGRRCQVGGSIIAPGGEEEKTKLTFINFESLCYVDVFTLFYWNFTSFYFRLFYHLFGIESLYFFLVQFLVTVFDDWYTGYKFQSI